MRYYATILLVFAAAGPAAGAPADQPKRREARLYVPYRDLAAVIDPAARSVLMDRGEFRKLLAAAEAGEPGKRLGQLAEARYRATVTGRKLAISGELVVVSLSDRPVAVPLNFALLGLTKVTLGGRAAPLGYDRQGRLVVIVAGRGPHRLAILGAARLADLPGGGMQFGLSLPEAVAATMTLTAPGDLDVHATVPVRKPVYDRQADRTTAELTLGGRGSLTVVLTGNGRQEDDRAILLAESTTSVRLAGTHQVLSCVQTVRVLRRGVRELVFRIPAEWTVTAVTCPSLLRWSVAPAGADGAKRLVVGLRRAERGTQAVHVAATAPRKGAKWRSPGVTLEGADFQRGYLIVETDDELRIRGEKLDDARREAGSSAGPSGPLAPAPGGRLFHHWGARWGVRLDLTTVAGRRTGEDRQMILVATQQITLDARFDVTAVGREMFDMAFELPDEKLRWSVSSVTVAGRKDGFQYRVETDPGTGTARAVAGGPGRVLRIELARPVPPEAVAKVGISLRHVPGDWDFRAPAGGDAPSPREISVPLIRAVADSVAGVVGVQAAGDLAAEPLEAPKGLKPVTVGRMATVGLARNVQAAWTYDAPVDSPLQLRVSRRTPRISARSVGLISVAARKAVGDWRVNYIISRASARTLYLAADASLGQKLRIETPGRRLASKKRTSAPGDLAPDGFDLWTLTLDGKAAGDVPVLVHYERPLAGDSFTVPLVRPVGVAQAGETLAVQASEELAVTVDAVGATGIDAFDLPPLPAPAERLLAAWRLQSAADGKTIVTLKTALHENYSIPSALVTDANLQTFLGAAGRQRTAATFNVVNAGMQFLTFSLPEGAELWSVRVGDSQAKPRRDAKGRYLVAIGRARRPVPVRIVYAWQAAPAGEVVELGGVTLAGVKINKARWTVTPPAGYVITGQKTRMQTGDLVRPRPACARVLTALVGVDLASTFGSMELARQAPAPEPTISHTMDESSSLEFKSEAEKHPAVLRRGWGAEARPAGDPTDRPPTAKPDAGRPRPATQPAIRRDARVAGRYTLPVELTGLAAAGPSATFTALGRPELAVTLTSESRITAWTWVGFLLIAAFGVARLNARFGAKCAYVVAVGAAASLVAVVFPSATPPADGAFYAAMALIPLYLAVWVARLILRAILGGPVRAPAAGAVLLAVCLAASSPAFAGVAGGKSAPAPPAPVPAPRPAVETPLVVPYEGDATQAHKADKVLVPYRRFVELWNRAHPDEPIELPGEAPLVSMAGAAYEAVVRGKELHVELTVEIRATGEGVVAVPMPISGLAVTDATLNGEKAALKVGPAGMVLTVRGGQEGKLRVNMVASPKWRGRRGSLTVSLPPLPAAVMTVTLPQADLVLEAPALPGALTSRPAPPGVQWTVPLGAARKLTLRWLPKAGGGAMDRTLSAATAHDVYAYHWGLLGATKVAFTFSASDYDRFALLVPEGLRITSLTGANLRDYRTTGRKTVDGLAFNVVEVRLYRPTRKRYELTARWIGPLPPLDEPVRLSLPRAADVGREGGTVTLHAAGGMSLKVPAVRGGRRSGAFSARTPDAADTAEPVAQYYWPYRPFAITVQLARHVASPTAELDQLVRISAERVQLLVRARLAAERGRVFGASFALPDGYELLSALGPDVQDFYVQPTPGGRRLHVNLRTGVTATNLALVLVRDGAKLERFDVPTVSLISPDGEPLARQTGRLAVQVAAALAAHTAASENLRSIRPQEAGRNWLPRDQVNAVQFAYSYETPKISLRLAVKARPSKVRVQIVGGLVVNHESAWYAYRLRYIITGSPIDKVAFSLPSRYAPLVAVASPSLRSVAKDDAPGERTKWTVSLVNEVTGVLDVAVNFFVPIDQATTSLPVPTITTDAPGGYRAVLAVQNLSRHELALGKTHKLAPLPIAEQRKLLTAEARRNLQYVLQSFEDDWTMALKFTAAKPAKRVQAVVDLLAITTVIDRGGQCRYQVNVALQNRSEQFLRVRVPAGVKLWSAHVAGRPVRPVTDADAADDEILIPLVKTSPGGLPYDVKLYLAGEGLSGLDGVTRLTPPAIRIVGIGVTRTTWTLRLPGGYRYLRPGGNVSPVAGTAEMMTIALQARMDQFKRLKQTYGEMISMGRSRAYVGKNWDEFNRKLSGDIKRTQREIEKGRGELGEKKYRHLVGVAGTGYFTQTGGQADIVRAQKRMGQVFRGNTNFILNNDANNPGLAEWQRDDSLNTLPSFVNQAAEGQKANLAKSQQEVLKGIKKVQQRQQELTGDTVSKDKEGKGKDTGRFTRWSDDPDDAKEAQVRQVLEKLADEQAGRLERQQSQQADQLARLADNRLLRYYDRAGNAPAQGQPQGQSGRQQHRGQQQMGSHVGYNAGVLIQSGGTVGGVGGLSLQNGVVGSNAASNTIMPRSELAVRDAGAGTYTLNGGLLATGGDVRPARPGEAVGTFNWVSGGGGGGGAPGGYVAAGMMSLPVELPAGGVELHFARPGGDAAVTLWAVRTSMLDGLGRAGGVLLALVVVFIAARLWRHWAARAAVPARGSVIAYVVLLALLLALLGPAGLILAVLLVPSAELIRWRARRRAQAA